MLISTLGLLVLPGSDRIGRIERGQVHVGIRWAYSASVSGSVGDGRSEQGEDREAIRVRGWSGRARNRERGEIVAVAGLAGVEIGKTVTAPDHLDVWRHRGRRADDLGGLLVNNSPGGPRGEVVTGRQLRERSYRELERNGRVAGRGHGHSVRVHLVGAGRTPSRILMETMRREGYEFQVSRARIIRAKGRTAALEPYES